LIFVAPILLNILFNVIDGFSWRHGFDFFPNIVFGSLSGTFVLAYIVLWIVLPEAHSTYEKMEMRGEKVDVNSISQNVKEGADSMKERMKDWTEEVKESAHNFSKKAKEFANTRGKTFASEVSSTARSGGRGLGHVIGVVFKAFFLFIAGTIAFALFCALIGLLFGGVAWWPVNGFLWTSKWQQLYAWGTLIFFLIVPLVGFIMWVVRRIIRVRSKSNYLGWTFGFLWTIGWVSAILLAASVWNDFSEYKYSEQPLSITQPVKGKMILAVSKPELEYTGRFGWLNDGGDGWDLSTDTLRMSTVRFRVIASTDSQYHVVLRRYSYGKTTADAISRAEDIQYSAYSRDSILDLDNGYTISKQSKFRFQQIEIEVQVPIGKKIRFDHSVTDKLNPMNFWVERKRRNNRSVRLDINDERSFIFAVDTDYTMGVDGNLTDPSGRTLYDNYYRNYRGNDDNLERQLEREKQKLEESERRTKELEERLNEKKKSTEAKPESMDDKDEVSMSGSSSPVVSLVSWIY
jgi:hypothetical protein